jgi:hypothetical protein
MTPMRQTRDRKAPRPNPEVGTLEVGRPGIIRELPATVPCLVPTARGRYEPPRLEALGAWSALTLQQSIGIGPGDF